MTGRPVHGPPAPVPERFLVVTDDLATLGSAPTRGEADAMAAASGGFVTTHSGYAEMLWADLPFLD